MERIDPGPADVTESEPVFAVTAQRDGAAWRLCVDGVGEAPLSRLSLVGTVAGELIAAHTGLPRDGFWIELTVRIDTDLDAAVAAALADTAHARRLNHDAAVRVRDVARRLHAAGLTQAEIAVVLGVSRQRVSQLFAE